MKRMIVLFALSFFIVQVAYSGSRDLFSIDEAHIQAEMAGLTELESYLSDNQYTMAEMLDQGHFMLSGLNSSSAGMHTMLGFYEPPLGFPSFLWGLCLGIPGVLVVHFVAEDRAETRKAIMGCLISSIAYTVFYIAWYAAWAGTL